MNTGNKMRLGYYWKMQNRVLIKELKSRSIYKYEKIITIQEFNKKTILSFLKFINKKNRN